MKKKYALLLVCPLIPILLFCSRCVADMSLEEAKEVTTAASEKSFVPPPRKINDINDLLNKKGIFQSKIKDSYSMEAEKLPPSGADDAALKEFYEKRGFAAFQLGRYKQALEDMRLAYDYLRKSNGKRNVLVVSLSLLEGEVGNFKAAINLLESEIPKNPHPWGMYSYLTQLYLQAAPFIMVGDPGE